LSNIVCLANYQKKRRKLFLIKPLPPLSSIPIVDFREYKKKRDALLYKEIHNAKMNFLGEVYRNLNSLESELLKEENKHGSKIFKKGWQNLSLSEKEALATLFNSLKGKLDSIERRSVKFLPYKKPP